MKKLKIGDKVKILSGPAKGKIGIISQLWDSLECPYDVKITEIYAYSAKELKKIKL